MQKGSRGRDCREGFSDECRFPIMGVADRETGTCGPMIAGCDSAEDKDEKDGERIM